MSVGPAAQLISRLRGWSGPSWRHGTRVEDVRSALDELAGLATAADGQWRPPVPFLGVQVLPDQLVVLMSDAAQAGVPMPAMTQVMERLSARLGFRTAGR